MMKRSHILGCLFLLFAAVSCRYNERELDDVTPSKVKSDAISFNVGTAKSLSPQTKSAMSQSAPAKVFIGMVEDDSLFVTSYVSDNRDLPAEFAGLPATKGEMVTAENLTGFYTKAHFTPEEGSPLLKYFDLTYIDSSEKVDGVYSLDYYWPQKSLDFFAVNFDPTTLSSTLSSMDEVAADAQWTTKASSTEDYGSSTVVWEHPQYLLYDYDEDGNPVATFSYALPVPDSEYRQDAVNQPDYVFAMTPGRTEENGVVPLNFAHCFSAVTFKLGPEFLNETGRQVKEVNVSGVPSCGICTITPAETEDGALNFTWDTDEADRLIYRQSISSVPGETNVANNSIINDGEMTFMLIPHVIQDDETIEFVFTMHDGLTSLDGTFDHTHEYVVSVKLAELITEWLPGKKYTFGVSAEETVGIEVTDEFISKEPLVKGNLSITNTGSVAVYVRAYLVGWWENSEGIVVAPWTRSDGVFVGAGWTQSSGNDVSSFTGEGSKWFNGSDGFFYYKLPVEAGQTTEKLFDTYTLTAVSPNPDARLILNVVTQAVLHYQVEQAWPHATSTVGINGFRVSNTESYW